MSPQKNFNLHDAKSGAAITVRVNNGGKENRITQIDDDGTIFINVPGSDENTNRALISFLAETLKIKPSQLDILAGQGQDRLITIIGLNAEQVSQQLLAAVKRT